MPGPYELVDNDEYGSHKDALNWLSVTYPGPFSVATGFVGLGGLDTLARLLETSPRPLRLLLGAAPPPGLMAGERETESEPQVRNQFEESLQSLRRERDFQSFPPLRRAMLERVATILKLETTQVKRYTQRFLHGKAYLLGELDGESHLKGQGTALVSSANLTSAGLAFNLELGLVHYQPNVVRMALSWYNNLWEEAAEYKEELLDLLLPPLAETDPQTVFLRALLELYGDELPEEATPETRPGGTLASFQRDGYERARRILEKYRGVLYADGVGTGKTEIGLAFISEYAKEKGLFTLIISPAQLRDRTWERRLNQANLPGQVVSYQELAKDRQLVGNREGCKRVLNVDKDAYRLIVVDEAHAFRNPDTTWYEAMDKLMGGVTKDLVMLTATPVNNTLWDLHSLFLLFGRHDGAFANPPLRIRSMRRFFLEIGANDPEAISEARLFPLIDAVTVRRDRSFLEKHYPNDHFPDGTPVRFPKPQLIERRYDLDRAYPNIVHDIVRCIDSLTMARYRPTAYRKEKAGEAADEEALAGLIKSGLLKRFESSWHAAHETVKFMVAANSVVLEALRNRGLIPPLFTIRELASQVQGGLPVGELVAEALEDTEGSLPANSFMPEFERDIQKDLNTLSEIERKLHALGRKDDPKLLELWNLLKTTDAKKVAVFTAYEDTARYIQETIESHPAVTQGRAWTVVIGNETDADTREHQLERFCPHSVTGDPKFAPGGGEIDLLISTDVLSEGQNLQEAQAVISYDMPWNPQRVVQRNGRIIRLKSPHEIVFLYTLLPKKGDLELILGLEARIRTKIAAANASVGMETPVLASVPMESKIYADLTQYTGRLSAGDTTLLESDDGFESGALRGEEFRARLLRALAEGELGQLKSLPWGIGSAFIQPTDAVSKIQVPGVFFACRTKQGERYWRYVTLDGNIVREDLTMLRLIDSISAKGSPVPQSIDLEALFNRAAADICESHNKLTDPRAKEERLPASQRWALTILRHPDAPTGKDFDDADLALGVGRDALVRRALSQVRRQREEANLGIKECAQEIVQLVRSFGLAPVAPPPSPNPIAREDLGVVCYQVVLPRNV
jgi:superfamily II DNA or RNA helicase